MNAPRCSGNICTISKLRYRQPQWLYIGATDPNDAAEGTIRKLYADSKAENIVHGSDSDENAAIEIAHFFTRKELLENYGL